jgi:hypothetical protein
LRAIYEVEYLALQDLLGQHEVMTILMQHALRSLEALKKPGCCAAGPAKSVETFDEFLEIERGYANRNPLILW